jgi:hypothetical protein
MHLIVFKQYHETITRDNKITQGQMLGNEMCSAFSGFHLMQVFRKCLTAVGIEPVTNPLVWFVQFATN